MCISCSSSSSSSAPFSLCGGVNISETPGWCRTLLPSILPLANSTITGRGENTSRMQSTQARSTTPRSKHIFFLSVTASCCPRVPWPSWNRRNLLLLTSRRLCITARSPASFIRSTRLLCSDISLSLSSSHRFEYTCFAFSSFSFCFCAARSACLSSKAFCFFSFQVRRKWFVGICDELTRPRLLDNAQFHEHSKVVGQAAISHGSGETFLHFSIGLQLVQ